MPQASIIHSFIDKLPPADKTTWFRDFRDTALAGSVLSVGLSPKIFHAAVEFNHSFRRMKIGRDDAVQANVARRIARDEMLPSLRQGIDPRSAKPMPADAPETLEQAWEEYRRHGSQAKCKTLAEYDRTLRRMVGHWFDRPTVTIGENEEQRVMRQSQIRLVR